MGASKETTVAVDPKAFDRAELELYRQLEQAERKLSSATDTMHRAAGDKRDYLRRSQPWGMSWTEAYRNTTSEARGAYDAAHAGIVELQDVIASYEAEYAKAPWTRYFPCLNTDGHIHASYRGCSTVYHTTQMGWDTELSGESVEDAVTKLGPALCSVCFASAPVEHKSMTLGQVAKARTQDERDAAKAEREAKKAAKNLTEDEQFEDTWGWVTTVAGAIKVLRDEREYYYYYGRGPHPSHAKTAEAAKKAREVLAAREARHPGWGKTGAEIAQIVERADKKNRKEAGL